MDIFLKALAKTTYTFVCILSVFGILFVVLYIAYSYSILAGIGLMLLLLFSVNLYYSYIEEREKYLLEEISNREFKENTKEIRERLLQKLRGKNE